MQRTSLALSSVVALTLAGCGGDASPTLAPTSTLQAEVAPDRMPIMSSMTVSGSRGRAVAEANVRVIAAYRDNYTIAQRDGVLTLANKLTGAAQTMHDVELIKFADKHVRYDIEGAGGKVYRLYQAAFNRKPDHDGLGYWIAMSEQGATMESIGKAFTTSKEYADMYGAAPSATIMVTNWYNNVLHRAPEQDGLDFWVRALNSGVSPEQALIGFSESAENKKQVLADLSAGIEYTPLRKDGEPLVPQFTSYGNMKNNGFRSENLDGAWQGDASAFGDFFQDGTMSIVTHTLVYDYRDINTSDKFGQIKFFQKAGGRWVDNTSKLLSDTIGCLHPRKAVVADFNGDARADVFFACHGFDAPPYIGEKQVFLMSQPDGTYKNTKTAFACFCHGASAAVLKNKGYADLLIADQTVEKRPYFLINNGDGSFSKDFSRLPDLAYKQIWTAELIDIDSDGKVDAFLAGADPQGDGYQIPPTFFLNDGANAFNGRKIEIPLVPLTFNNAASLDIVLDGSAVYLLRTNYAEIAVQRTDLPARSTKTVYHHAGPYVHGAWFPWMTVQGDVLIPFNIDGVRIPKD